MGFPNLVSIAFASRLCTQYVETLLENHGMKDANPVVTPALARNDDDANANERTPEEQRILRRVAGKSQCFASRKPDIAFETNRVERSSATPTRADHLCGWIWVSICRYTPTRRRCSPTAIGRLTDPARKSVSS